MVLNTDRRYPLACKTFRLAKKEAREYAVLTRTDIPVTAEPDGTWVVWIPRQYARFTSEAAYLRAEEEDAQDEAAFWAHYEPDPNYKPRGESSDEVEDDVTDQ